MTIDFGTIKSYNPDKGFGFIGHTFFNPNKKVFFHIRKVKKEYLELAQKLDSGENCKKFNFWYEIEMNERGEEVSKFWLNSENIPKTYTYELCDLIQKVESIWKNVDSPKPYWLDFVTIQLVGDNRKHELSVDRDNLKIQLREAEEKRHKEAEILKIQLREAEEKRHREAEILKQNEIRRIDNEIRRIGNSYNLKEAESQQLEKLLEEMRPLGFTHSKQLSTYIHNHRLGSKYPKISGILTMEGEGAQWDFKGGFPPNIYKIICKELNLNNEGTHARAVHWESYESLGYNS